MKNNSRCLALALAITFSPLTFLVTAHAQPKAAAPTSLATASTAAAPANNTADIGAKIGQYVGIRREVLSKLGESKDKNLAAVESGFDTFNAIVEKDPSDFLARSFAGVFASMRAPYVEEMDKKAAFTGEALPMLDKSARDAKKAVEAGAPSEVLALVLENRAEVLINLPKLFKKEAIALADAQSALEITKKTSKDEKDIFRTRLLVARALAYAGKASEAQAEHDAVATEAKKKNIDLSKALKRTADKISQEKSAKP